MAVTGRHCLLHIGVPKTGSTSLQRFLTANTSGLARAGWSYPDVSRRGWGHHDLAFLLGDGYPAWAVPQPRNLDDLARQLADECRSASRVIISSENFYLFADPIRTRDLLADSGFPPGTIGVVVYLRRQDDMHLSWYNQAVKAQGFSGSLAQSIEETFELWDYAARLAAWSDAFGHDRLAVRVYPAGQADAASSRFDVRCDFLRAAGIDPEPFDFDAAATNTRLNRDVLEFQRTINRLPLPATAKRAFHRELMALTAATAATPLFADHPLLDGPGRRGLLERYARGNAEVARRYLGRDELFAPDPADDGAGPPCGGEWPGLTAEKVAAIVGWLLVRRDATGAVE